MEKSTLIPFLRPNLHILFVGLNPAKGSSDKGHYFSVNQAFWNQLYDSKLITKNVDKDNADVLIFGSNVANFKNWNYGITDLVSQIAESNSKKIRPTNSDCEKLKADILEYRPKISVLLHQKVLEYFLNYLDRPIPASNSGSLGQLIQNCETMFFNVAFPHGNSITSEAKIKQYRKIVDFLDGQ